MRAFVVFGPMAQASRHARFYATAAWKAVRRRVWERDDYTCSRCGTACRRRRGDDLPLPVADHCPPLTDQLAAGGSGLDLSLLRTLCSRCSGKVDGPRGGGRGRANRAPRARVEFLSLERASRQW